MSLKWLFLLLLIGCGRAEPKQFLIIDSRVQMYVNQFEKIGNLKISRLVVKFDTLDEGMLGNCAESSTPTITLNNYYFKNQLGSHLQMEALMFHELGHCILQRKHSTSLDSLMYPSLVDEFEYQTKYALYISELFGINYIESFDEGAYE